MLLYQSIISVQVPGAIDRPAVSAQMVENITKYDNLHDAIIH